MLNDENTRGLSEAATFTIPDTEVISSPDTSFSECEERIQRPRRVLKESFVKGSVGGREEGAVNDENFSPLRVPDSHTRGGVSGGVSSEFASNVSPPPSPTIFSKLVLFVLFKYNTVTAARPEGRSFEEHRQSRIGEEVPVSAFQISARRDDQTRWYLLEEAWPRGPW